MTFWTACIGVAVAWVIGSVHLAQADSAMTLQAPPIVVAEPGAETPLPLVLSPSTALPQAAFVRIRGLPTAVSLSDGHLVTTGVWAVPLFALPTLTMDVPVGVTGRSELQLALVTANGQILAEARTAVVVATLARRGRPDVKDTARLDAPALAQGFAAAPPAAPPEPQRDTRILDGGRAAFQAGRIAAARLYFERAARDGDGRAALLMGETYDPEALAPFGTYGPLPDVEAAALWYERALSLGDPDATGRLERLRRSAACLRDPCPAKTR